MAVGVMLVSMVSAALVAAGLWASGVSFLGAALGYSLTGAAVLGLGSVLMGYRALRKGGSESPALGQRPVQRSTTPIVATSSLISATNDSLP